MGKSPILQIDELAQGMTQAFQVANDAVAALEETINLPLTIDASVSGNYNGAAGGNFTLITLDLLRYNMFVINGLPAARTMTVPSEVDTVNHVKTYRNFLIWNNSSFDLTVTTDAPGRTVTVHAGQIVQVQVWWDGVSISNVDPCGGNEAPHSVAGFIFGSPGSSDEVQRYNFAEAVSYLANFSGSKGSVRVNPTTFTAETGSINFSSVADINIDTVTIFDGRNTTVFNFKTAGNGATGASVDVAIGATATNSAQNLKAAINANTNINCTASGAANVITITNNLPFHGAITKVDADNDYAVTDFSGGSFYQLDVQKNAVSIGTIGIDSSGNVSFVTASNAAESFAVGDIMTVIAPASVDATAAGIAWTLKGRRN